jgi:hypothetical protein
MASSRCFKALSSTFTGSASIDFEAGVYESIQSSTDAIPVDGAATAASTLQNAVTANSTHPLFLLLGIEFYQVVNGASYTLKNGAFNALSLVKVSGI